MRKNKKIYKRLFIGIIAIYVVFTLANQQKTLNQYTKNISELSDQIQEQKDPERNQYANQNFNGNIFFIVILFFIFLFHKPLNSF